MTTFTSTLKPARGFDGTEAFHAGEQALQERVGMRERMAEIGPLVIRDHLPDQHRDFFERLPFMVVGSVDPQGQPWASVLAGPPGFVRSPDASRLQIRALPAVHDPLHANLVEGAPVGLLGIEPHTRRRNRLNGRVRALHAGGFTVEVQQSFGNCPQYIHRRELHFDSGPVSRAAHGVEGGAVLDEVSRRLIEKADTLFIASSSGASVEGMPGGLDISHRGGPAGFVQMGDDGVLALPDYPGNRFFNTLGNLLLEPRAGLLFIDFARGDLLHLAVRADIVWDGPRVAALAGAERLLRLTVTSWRRVERALPLRWHGTR